MGFYARCMLPRLTHLVMSSEDLVQRRVRVAGAATGTVLEIGVGSGLNLSHYGPHVTRVIGVDPSAAMLRMAARAARSIPVPVEFLNVSAESLPVRDATVDTAVTTWTLCSISDPAQALREVRRTLRPGGRLLFVEHGHAADRHVARVQRRLTPVWKRCAGGCHLDRRIDSLMRSSGFAVTELRTEYGIGPRPFSFTYEGAAVLATQQDQRGR